MIHIMMSAVPIGYWFLVCSGLIVVFMSAASWNKYSYVIEYPEANCTAIGNFSMQCLGPLCSCCIAANYTIYGWAWPGTVTLKNPIVSPLCLTATQCHRWRDSLLEQEVPCHIRKPTNDTIGYTTLDITPIYVSFAIGITLLFIGLLTAGIYHTRDRTQTRFKSRDYMLIQAGA